MRGATGLVLSGGGARGAYEAGVISFLRDELEPGLGRRLPIHVLSGTSVGAINACHLAAHATTPSRQGTDLCARWRSLSLEQVLHVRSKDLVRVSLEVVGVRKLLRRPEHGGVVDPAGLRAVVMGNVEWRGIRKALASGDLQALAVSATHVSSGRTFTFFDLPGGRLPPWTRDPHYEAVAARIGPRLAIASASIPLLFPPVRIRGELFADGGLRLNVPLSPALRAGAQRVIVVSLRHERYQAAGHDEDTERAFASAPFLAGKTLNALLLDRTEQDLERLRRINAILEAGAEAYGEQFPAVLNHALVRQGVDPLRYVRNILVHPSQDIAAMAADYARSPTFSKRARGITGWTLRTLAEQEAKGSADLASYLLFDGDFAEQLIELGRHDARALGARWVRFFSERPISRAEHAEEAGPTTPLGAPLV